MGPEVLRGLRKLARDHDVSLYVLLLAAYAVLHQRLTLSHHVRLGTLIANRGRGNTSDMVGFLANTLPLDIRIDDAEPFSALVQQVKRKVIGLHDHQDVQFDSLVQALQPERAHNKNPLFQVLFVLQNAQIERLSTPRADWRLKIWESDTAKFDLSIQAFERDGDLDLVFEYRRDLFPRQDVARWVEAYHTVLRDLPGLLDPEVGHIDIVPEAERERILSVNGPLDAPLPSSIPAVLSAVARERADRPALVMGAESYTFAELWDRSAAYAAYLRAEGVVPGSRVGITARRSPHVVIAMIAVARLGAAYVPVRPSDPEERRKLVLSDSEALVLLDDAAAEPLGDVLQLPLAVYDAAAPDSGPAWHETDAASTPAYIMYTSGSTGRPKGVAVSVENVLRLAHQPDFVELGPGDVVLQTGSLTFDASTLEVWGALLNGVALHLVDEHVLLDITALREAIDASGATVMWMSAPLFSQIVDSDPGVFGTLRQLLVGGDVLPPRQIRAVVEACPGIRIINGYGPTENTTFSTTYRIPDDVPADRAIPIGRPIGHSSAYVLSGTGRLQPIGVPGELHVGGRGVALGYVNRDDLTAAAFLDDPFAEGGRMYRTGDLVRLNDELDLEFMGGGPPGWFTSMYPAVLRGAGDGATPVADVQAVREELRAIPGGGDDYGVLAYLDHSVPPLVSAVPVAFNYLGAMPSGMELASSAYGDFRSGASRRECAIEFNLFKYGDDLKVSMRVDRAFADSPEVVRLLEAYERNLLALAEGLDGAPAPAPAAKESAALPAADREAVLTAYGDDDVQHILSLTPTQEGLLYHELMHPGGSDYFGQVVTTLHGSLDLPAFEAAWNIVIAENEMLRTVYGWENLSRPVQIVLGSAGFRIDHRDLTDRADEAERRRAVDDLLAADIATGFDLTAGPLLRVTVVRTADDEHVFAFSFPHISLDGWSVFRILARTLELYDAGVPEPGAIEPAPSFRSYAEWLGNLDLTEARAYWSRYLTDSTPWVLPPEARSTADEDRFSQLDLVLDEEETTLVREFAARAHCTLSTVLQTALALTLRIVSGADDVIFGVTVSGRSPDVPDVERVVGLLINTLPMRVRMAGDEPVDSLMGRIQTDGFGAIEHSGLATTHILESAGSERGAGSGSGKSRAQFDVLFILENYPLGPEFLRSKNLGIGSFASHERTNYPLTVVAIPGERLTVRFSSMTGVVEPAWVSAFMGLFRTALHQVSSGHRLVADVDGVDAAVLADLLRSSQNAPTVEAEHEDQQRFFADFRGPVFVLDEQARPCPVGVPGHIHVAADSVSDLPVDGEWGQWMAEGETEPGFPSPHRYLYPTGDVGMWTSRDSIKLLD
ncbi:D-alanine--D-alanyl carrier protein ligase [Streptomyces cyaneofuscatus]